MDLPVENEGAVDLAFSDFDCNFERQGARAEITALNSTSGVAETAWLLSFADEITGESVSLGIFDLSFPQGETRWQLSVDQLRVDEQAKLENFHDRVGATVECTAFILGASDRVTVSTQLLLSPNVRS